MTAEAKGNDDLNHGESRQEEDMIKQPFKQQISQLYHEQCKAKIALAILMILLAVIVWYVYSVMNLFSNYIMKRRKVGKKGCLHVTDNTMKRREVGKEKYPNVP